MSEVGESRAVQTIMPSFRVRTEEGGGGKEGEGERGRGRERERGREGERLNPAV